MGRHKAARTYSDFAKGEYMVLLVAVNTRVVSSSTRTFPSLSEAREFCHDQDVKNRAFVVRIVGTDEED